MFRNIRVWLGVSITTMVVCAAIIVFYPPVLGVDFTGGSLLEFTTPSGPNPTEVHQLLLDLFQIEATVQSTGDRSVLARMNPITDSQRQEIVTALKDAQLATQELRFELIGPTMGAELRQKSLLAIGLAMVIMILYLAYTFRHTGGLVSSWKFGIAAAVALIHDLLLVTALFSLFGVFFGATIDALFVTAMLAIFGYSVNDTIVYFNRMKSEWLATRTGSLHTIMERAFNATLMRSLNTALPILVVLLVLLFFGGTTIRWFIVALTVGTITGAYSSLFVAPPVLAVIAKRKR